MRVLIVGCGYVGIPLGAELVRLGHEVFGLRRTAAAAEQLTAAGIKPLAGDITRPDDLAKLPGPFDWVVNSVSAGGGDAEVYRSVYLEGTRNLIDWLATMPPKKFVYTSSTSVYGQNDGSMVKEGSQTEPATETSRVLVETEKLLIAAVQAKKVPALILRVAGIYGPERTRQLHRFLKNEARLEGKGERVLNMIHRDDVVGCILTALKNGRPGEIYNAVDDEPVSQLNFYEWIGASVGKWMPPSEPVDPESVRKRGLTSKKVSNRRLKMELGYQFKYPNFRKGYTVEMQRLDQAGQLDITPDHR